MPHISESMQAIWQLLREHNVMAMGVLIFIEEMGVPLPLPGNLLLMYLGMLIAAHRVSAGQTLIIMTLASMAGSIVLYCVAVQIGRPAVLRWGRYVGLDHKRVARIEAWLGRYGSVTIFLGRCMPGLRTPTSAVGGIFGVPLPMFIPFTGLAAWLWTGFWLLLGGILGRNLHLQRYLSGSHFTATILFAAACLLILPAIGFISARRQRQEPEDMKTSPLSLRDDVAGTSSPTDAAPASQRGEPAALPPARQEDAAGASFHRR